MNLKLYVMADNSSMYPTLKKGDTFLVLTSIEFDELERGDIILLKNHLNTKKQSTLTKRIIGLPTDTILITNNNISVNKNILIEDYLESDSNNNLEKKLFIK